MKLNAIIATLILTSTAALAADKGGAPTPAPAPAVVASSPFAGAYIGAHAGYSQLTDESSFNGWLGGVHGGFGIVTGGIYVGGEIDWSLSTANITAGDGEITIKAQNDWLASARARVGLPMGNLMPYATAGIAWGKFKARETDGETTISDSATERLWVAGLGLEYALTNAVNIRGEYLQYFESGAVKDGLGVARMGMSVKLN